MNKKQAYCFNTTLKQNNLLNYYRCYGDVLDNEQRTNNIYNNIRDNYATDAYQQTDNFDKYFNTRYIDFVRMTARQKYFEEDEEDDF